jgi:hypothetical protein
MGLTIQRCTEQMCGFNIIQRRFGIGGEVVVMGVITFIA